MTEIADLPARTSIANDDLLLIYYSAAASNPSRKITFADFADGLVRENGDADLGTVEVTDLTADAATLISTKIGATGANLTGAFRAAAAIALGDLSAGAGATHTVTVTGAASGDHVSLNFTAALPDGVMAQAWVSAANTVSVRFFNATGGTITGATHNARVLVIKAS